MAAERFDSRLEQSRKYTADRPSDQPAQTRLRASDKGKRNPAIGISERSRAGRVGNEVVNSGSRGMFEEPRSGNDRRIQLIPYMIPDSGCRRKRNRRSWRSHLNSGEWWMLRDYLRRD